MLIVDLLSLKMGSLGNKLVLEGRISFSGTLGTLEKEVEEEDSAFTDRIISRKEE